MRDHVITGCGMADEEQGRVIDPPNGTLDASIGLVMNLGEPMQ